MLAETKKKTIENTFICGLKFETETITNLEEKKEFKIKCCGNEYLVKAILNEDRGGNPWQSIVINNGRTNSLSFFPTKKEALRNANLFIAAHNGRTEDVKSKIGD